MIKQGTTNDTYIYLYMDEFLSACNNYDVIVHLSCNQQPSQATNVYYLFAYDSKELLSAYRLWEKMVKSSFFNQITNITQAPIGLQYGSDYQSGNVGGNGVLLESYNSTTKTWQYVMFQNKKYGGYHQLIGLKIE